MIARIFVTGGTGFLGRRVVDLLRRQGGSPILLDRSGSEDRAGAAADPVERVHADLLEPDRYLAQLATAELVLHMAGRTGRAPASAHFRDNAAGTATLLDACRRAGVQRILFVSSIAAKFPDRTGYPYAQAKLEAEQAVRGSGLRFIIIRPTIILGDGSPILGALEQLAQLPIIPIFGDGRTLVQPIHVDDLADIIVGLLAQGRFDGETLELGGPVAIPIQELIQQIRLARTGTRGYPLHLPLRLTASLLRAAEAGGLAGVLPLNAGQLSTFRFDGTVAPNPVHDSRRAALRGVPEMLARREAS